MEDLDSHRIRLAVFDWLRQSSILNEFVFDWQDLTSGFRYQNETVPLIGAKGIWKPKIISRYPISIASVLQSIYSDRIIDDSSLYYSYRGIDPRHPDNVGLKDCMTNNIPLVYFHQIIKGKYFAVWPVFIVGDEPQELRFRVSVDENKIFTVENRVAEPEDTYRRKYQTRQVIVRLHQQIFRELILRAYRNHCAVCNLKYRSLLDAAHIIPDSLGGKPEIQNGLALCKIHHAAYDQNILGIRPDYQVEIREDILSEIDGPMLKYGLQKMNGSKLILPHSANNKPNRDGLDFRYQLFKSA